MTQEMQRANRLREEHEAHGWIVDHDEEATFALGFKPGYLMSCPCGWHGWVPAAETMGTPSSR